VFSVLIWLTMVFADFTVLFSDLRQVRPDVPARLPNFLLDLFILSLFIFYRLRIEKDESLDFSELLWKVFAVGLIATLFSLATRLIIFFTGTSAISSNILFNYLIYQVNFSLLLGFLMTALVVWKRLITYQRTKWVVQLWAFFELTLLAVLVHDSLGFGLDNWILIPLSVLALMMIVALSVSMKWVAYLNFRQKLTALLLILLVTFYLAYFAFTVTTFSGIVSAVSVAFLRFDVHVFNLALFLFVTVYGILSFLVILFNLPTSSAFEQKLEETLQFQRISQSIQTEKSEKSVYRILLESSLKSVSADAGWIEFKDKRESEVFLQIEATELEQIRAGLNEKNISLVTESGTFQKVAISRKIGKSALSFRSMLIVPVRVKGELLCSLCLLKELPDGFTVEMIQLATTFANQAGISVENFRLMEEVVQGERYKEELKIARSVQQSLLPAVLEQDAQFEVVAFSASADEVGGDYYDSLRINEHEIAAIIADVSGKGTTAAFHMSQMKGIFHSLARSLGNPVHFLQEANRALVHCLEKGSFISAVYIRIDSKAKKIVYARAGHCPVLVYQKQSGSAKFLTDRGAALGMVRNSTYDGMVEGKELGFKPGDIMLLYTDGITEARSPKGEEFGYERLSEALRQAASLDGAGIRAFILDKLYAFTEQKGLLDDYTMLIIRFKDNPTTTTNVLSTP